MSVRRNSGVGLIEVLVTLLVLSIGMIGLAYLQAFMLRSNQMSNFRTVATEKLYEAADLMRSFSDKVKAASDPCSVSEVKFDCQRWQAEIADLLPEGGGKICNKPSRAPKPDPNNHNCLYKCGNVPQELFVAQVWWKEREGNQKVWRCFEIPFQL